MGHTPSFDPKEARHSIRTFNAGEQLKPAIFLRQAGFNAAQCFGMREANLIPSMTATRTGPQSRTVMGYSNDLAMDPGVFVELVNGTKPVVTIRNHDLAVVLVSHEKQWRETLPLPNPFPVLLNM